MNVPSYSARRAIAAPVLLLALALQSSQVCAQTAPQPPARPSEQTNPQPPRPAETAHDAPDRLTVAEAVLLGVVEGLTEYLPVSSTGHLVIVSHALGQLHFSDETGPFGPKLEEGEQAGAFEIVIQLGAILAVLGLYRRRVGQMARGLLGRDRRGLRLLGLLLVAFLPAAVIGLLLRKPIKENLFSPLPVCWALAVGGVLMIVVEQLYRRRPDRPRVRDVNDVLFRQALFIGFAQCLAMWPGTSRSMITIVAALVVGLDMVAAAEFSFLLALPTLGAATVYEGATSWDALQASTGPVGLAVGLIVSGIVAALAVVGFVRWLTRHGLLPFGVYRIALAAAVYWYFYMQ